MKIKINGKFLSFFNELNLTRQLDSVASTFSFNVRFNGENDEHKDLFKPLSYFPVKIYSSKDKLIFTGTILNHSFSSNSETNLLSISGYSKSGILEDVTIPPKHYPLQSDNHTIEEIAKKVCGYYGINAIVYDSAYRDVNTSKVLKNIKKRIIKKTTCGVTDSVKSYLSKVTAQQNILLSHDEKGNVILFKPDDKMKPKYYFNPENTLEMSFQFNGQGMHSDINVVRQPSSDNSGSSTADFITNPLISVFRPVTTILSSGDDVDTSKAANNQLAAELKNITGKIKLVGLFDDIKPGDIVNVHNHETYTFAYVRYMVSSISLKESVNESITELDLVLPETFTGEQPKNILFFNKSHKTHI